MRYTNLASLRVHRTPRCPYNRLPGDMTLTSIEAVLLLILHLRWPLVHTTACEMKSCPHSGPKPSLQCIYVRSRASFAQPCLDIGHSSSETDGVSMPKNSHALCRQTRARFNATDELVVFPVGLLTFLIAVPSGLATCTALEGSRFDVGVDPSAFETAGLVVSIGLHEEISCKQGRNTWVL